jgi:hypothetical protein
MEPYKTMLLRYQTVNFSKHQWVTFRKGRMRVKACASCGELHLPSNSEQPCVSNKVFDSQLLKAGYKLYSST